MHALGVVGGVIDVVYLFTLIYRVPLVLSSMISNTKSMIFSDERLLLVHLRRLLSPFYATQKNLIADRTGRDKRWAWHGGALKGICCSASCFSLDAPNKLSQKKLVQSNNLGRPLGLALLSVFLLLLFIS